MTDLTVAPPPHFTDWYRLEDSYGSEDGGPRIYIRRSPVLRQTPKGVWLYDSHRLPQCERWVSTSARKRYAYPTYELALDSFTKRKEHQRSYLQNKLDHVNEVLAMLSEGLTFRDWWGEKIAERKLEPRNPWSLEDFR